MSFVGKFIQSVTYTTFATSQIVFLVAHLRGNTISGFESDAPNIICKAIRILFHVVDAFLAVLAIYFGGISSTYSVLLQKNHYILDVLLFLPTVSDFLYTFLTDASHFI